MTEYVIIACTSFLSLTSSCQIGETYPKCLLDFRLMCDERHYPSTQMCRLQVWSNCGRLVANWISRCEFILKKLPMIITFVHFPKTTWPPFFWATRCYDDYNTIRKKLSKNISENFFDLKKTTTYLVRRLCEWYRNRKILLIQVCVINPWQNIHSGCWIL